jgi:YVTN family beta-propeller protein
MKGKWLVGLGMLVASGIAQAQNEPLRLPNGWSLSPAGSSIAVGDLPLNMAVTRDGRLAAVTNNGFGTQSIQLVDVKAHRVLHTQEVASAWLGLKFQENGKYLYASCGNDNLILKYAIIHDSLRVADSIVLGEKWPEKICPTGIDIDEAAHILYAVTKEDNSLYVVDLSHKPKQPGHYAFLKVPLGAEAYTCRLSTDSRKLYISVWGDGKIAVFDTRLHRITDSFAVGRNPNDLCLTPNGKYLFVANSVDNTVSVIDIAHHKVSATLNAALFANAPSGSTTNSVCLSANGKTLYIANADNNCLAVFDVTDPTHCMARGYIPTGWYPTCVRACGGQLMVLNGKGSSSAANPQGPQPASKTGQAQYKKGNKKSEQYIGGLFTGSMSFIAVPDEKKLAAYSKTVYQNTPYTPEKEAVAEGESQNPVPRKKGESSPIKHVFYVIKENRTYDQVLGDLPQGNGDTSLVLFGRHITPNQHAIAEQFVLLDNFYVDAEVSADGHNWSMASYANDYVEKTWPTNYSGRGGTYDYAANKKVALPKNGFLWDYAFRAGLSVRDYGEFTDDDGNVYLPKLKENMCPAYPGWNLAIRDTTRERIWEHDFDSLTLVNKVPALNFVYFPNDHTAGLNKKNRSPFAYVADNDLAVGAFLEHLSNSPIWKDCAVFILEDDAQNGPDHVDAHRSTAYVAGPFVKHGYIDHTPYSTSGMLRTIELILGLPPMSQYDAAATPMYRSFTLHCDTAKFTHLPEERNLDEMNIASSSISNISDGFDLSAADKVPDNILSEVLWLAAGKNGACPPPRHAAFVKTGKYEKEDKDED